MAVFVLDKQKQPLRPCSEKRARLLLQRGRAVVVRLAPFAIRLKDRIGGAAQPLRLKLDPGSRTTGLALVREAEAIDPETGAMARSANDWHRPILAIRAAGRGSYQRTRLDRFGFPRGYPMRHKRVRGFQTGDRVIARVPTGKNAGVHVGRVAVRASGSFNLQTAAGIVQGLSHRHCSMRQRADGYGYSFQPKPDTEEARRAA